MKLSRIVSGVAIVAAGSLVLSACTPADPEDKKQKVVPNSAITVAWNDPYFAFNGSLQNTNATANGIVNYELAAGSYYYDNTPALVKNEKFAKIEKISDSPLKVKYTLTSDATWSDGVKITPADFLLSWAAFTTHRSDDAKLGDSDLDEEGKVKEGEKTKNLVLWNTGVTADRSLDLVKEVPEINNEERSITLTYSKPYVDWETAFDVSSIAVHKTMELAFPNKYKVTGDNAAEVGKQAQEDFVKAVKDNDKAVLAPFAKVFRDGYIFNSNPSPEDLKNKFVTSGAYVLSDFKLGQYVTLSAREDFTWGEKPHYQKITIKAIADPQAQIQALQNGEVQIVAAQPTADILKQVQGLKSSGAVDFQSSTEGAFEHVDLQTGKSSVFSAAKNGGDEAKAMKVRQAFLKTIPRQEIVDKLIKPLNPEATLRNSVIFLPGSEGYKAAVKENGVSEYDKTDIEGAKKLLAEAGVSNLKVRLLFAKTNPRRVQEYELMRQSAAKAGIELINASAEKWSADLVNKPDSYDAALFAWNSTSLNVGESGANYIDGGGNNYYSWNNARVNEIFKQLSTTVEPAEQQKLLVEAGTLINKNAWTVPLYQFPSIVAWSPKVAGVKAGFLAPGYFWNYWDWKPAGS